ncbi:VOC family protein [Amycolatopsis aidingensis]|uniref:VOC family protein n=1 Tax=Amycolatopsis aidingensis TaxID=2842453 RepID=UPI001C0E54EF|nr:VOC family protein [Amycolatopsis aidingensis]
MSTKIFVNLPVRDLDKSKEFFTKLGYSINEQFTDENASCVVISEDIYVMLLVESFFAGFTSKEVADATKTTEVTLALSADSRQGVDELVDKALAAGGQVVREPMDQGPMYGRSFYDLDGHLWEVVYMDPTALQ